MAENRATSGGVVERCGGNCDAAVRLAALRALLQLVARDEPCRATLDERAAAVARAFGRGCTRSDLEHSGVLSSEIAIAAVRLLL